MNCKEEQDAWWQCFEDSFDNRGYGKVNLSLPNEIETMERNSITNALKLHNNNRSHAANYLGIGRTCLLAKMKKYFID
jgi:transcriptional regulator with PAS, ATPase and Fis domain